jgi:hypothetical protein
MIALISVMIVIIMMIVTLEQRDQFGPEGVRFRLHVVRPWIGRIAGVNRYIYSNTPRFDAILGSVANFAADGVPV